MILFLEIKYRGKKKNLRFLFCIITYKQQGISENSLSSFGTVSSYAVAVQFKYPIFAFHLSRTLHMVCSRRVINLNLTDFNVAAHLITFTCNTTHKSTYLDKN